MQKILPIKLLPAFHIKEQVGELLILKKDGITRKENHITVRKEGVGYPVYDPYHLYVLSDDNIKDGEKGWYYNDILGGIHYSKGNVVGYKKVVASTDTSLGLPTIPKWYIEHYIKLYNAGKAPETCSVEYIPYCPWAVEGSFTLKLNNNELVITIPTQKEVFTREDMIAFADYLKEEDEVFERFGSNKVETSDLLNDFLKTL